MVEVTKLAGGYAFAFFFAGEVSDTDLAFVTSVVDEALERNESISLMCDLVDFCALTPQAVIKDLLHGIGSLGRTYRFERVAIVTDSAPLKALVELEIQLFPEIRLKSFHSTERHVALEWIALPIPKPPSGLLLTEVENGNYIRIEVARAVTGHDIRRLGAAVRQRYENSGPVNLLVKLESRPHCGPGLLYEKLRSMPMLAMVGKYAVVAPSWTRAAVEALGLVVRTRMRYFPLEQNEAAVRWLADKTPSVYLYPLLKGHTANLRLMGKLTEREVRQVYYLLLPLLEREGGIDLLLEVPYDEGVTLAGLAEAVRLAHQHFSLLSTGVRRVAVLTDVRWIGRLVQVENLFLPHSEERVFSFSQRAEAETWVSQGRELPDEEEMDQAIAAWDLGQP